MIEFLWFCVHVLLCASRFWQAVSRTKVLHTICDRHCLALVVFVLLLLYVWIGSQVLLCTPFFWQGSLRAGFQIYHANVCFLGVCLSFCWVFMGGPCGFMHLTCGGQCQIPGPEHVWLFGGSHDTFPRCHWKTKHVNKWVSGVCVNQYWWIDRRLCLTSKPLTEHCLLYFNHIPEQLQCVW